MPIDLTCSCGKRLRVGDEFAGRQGQCPSCGGLLEIPAAGSIVPLGSPSPRETAVTASVGAPAAVEPDSSDLPAWSDWHEPSRPWYKLYSPGCIGLVAFLTGPVGAFFLLILNYWRLGKPRAARLTIYAGVVTMAAVLILGFSLPESIPGLLIGIPLFVLIWIAARILQEDIYADHLRQGGQAASGWSAAGFGLLGLVLYLGIFYGAFSIYQQHLSAGFGTRLDFGGGEEVFYKNGATQADAWALGTFLRRDGYFNGQGPKSVRISRDGNRLVVDFVVQNWVFQDRPVQQEFRQLGQEISQQAFGGDPIEVHLCDEMFRVKVKL